MLAFDVFGAVVDWRSSVIAEIEQLAKAKGLDIDCAAFADAWRAIYRPYMDKVQNGELPWTKLDDLHRMMLAETLKKFDILKLSDDEKENLNRVWHRLNPWPDSVPGLQRLKSRFVITTLSNGNISLLTNMAKHAGLPWDCILSAENVRRYKPAPEVYLLPLRLFDLKPEEVMMVAAHEHDLQSASKHGLRTAYVHRRMDRGQGKESA
ncbi:MAG: haloacid dehalogenase type II [Deltaproteobacteria bacterium]|nr:haloacid dehalogenase type II [Deltaproteobacteria bacterium]